MPDLNHLDEEDEHSHRIDTDADGEAEDDVMITEVEKPKQRRSKRNITLREDSGKESDEEFVTHELFEDESNNNKMVESKGSSKYLISTKKTSTVCLQLLELMRNRLRQAGFPQERVGE